MICALAVLIALFAFRLWVALTSREASQALLNQFSGALGIVAWPFRLGQSVWHGLLGWMGPWLAVPAALVVVLGVLLPGLTLLLALRDGGFRGVRRDLVEIGAGWLWIGSFVVVVASPLILQAPKTLIEMAGLAFLVWLVPGVVLGGFVPFLRRLSRSPELWLATALMGAGLVCIAVWLADHAWFWLPLAGLGLVGGVAARAAQTSGDRARPECWPLLPISIALWVYGSTLILEQVTFRLLDDLHTLMSLQPSVTRLMPRQYAGDLMWTFPHGRLPWTGATTMKRELVRRLEQGDAWINERKSDAVSRSFQTVWAFVHGAPDEPHGATRSLSASHSETLHRPLLASLGRLQELARQSPTLVGQLEEISSQGQQMVTEAEALGDTWTANPSGASAPDILVRARQNFAEFIQGAHEIRALLPRLAGTIHQLQQHGGELEALTTQAAPQLARRLELCVSSAFGFWMTLACLAV